MGHLENSMTYEKNRDSGRPQRGGDRNGRTDGRKDFRKKDGQRNDRRGGPKKDFKGPRRDSEERKDFKGPRNDSKGPRKGFDKKGPRKGFESKGRPNRVERPRMRIQDRPALIISNDPQKLLFKGVDLQSKDDDNGAMLMFLHGSVLMSKGCENNARRMISSMDDDSIEAMREAISKNCSEDALVELDYIRWSVDEGYGHSFLDERFQNGSVQAVYRMICMGMVDGDDAIIDQFGKDLDDPRVSEGLRILAKKKDSKKAEKLLSDIEARKKRRQDINHAFTRAMDGNKKAVRDLERLSSEFREARFFLGYIKARDDGEAVSWLRDNYSQYSDIMISEEFNLRISEDPFGMFLRAKKIQSKKEDWIPSMIRAAKYGSDEAMEELRPLMHRTDIKKSIAEIHLRNKDLEGLINDYINGLDDIVFIDKYLENDAEKIADMGGTIGERNAERGIDWLRAHAFSIECRNELVWLSKDERYHSRKMIFALHDVGKEKEAAELFFLMDGSDEQPAVKWLRKVCRDEEAKEFIRQHYESIDDMATFDSIFEDDGYQKRPSFKGRGKPRGPFKRR